MQELDALPCSQVVAWELVVSSSVAVAERSFMGYVFVSLELQLLIGLFPFDLIADQYDRFGTRPFAQRLTSNAFASVAGKKVRVQLVIDGGKTKRRSDLP